jgi:mono/diheme cytochrome c family protein
VTLSATVLAAAGLTGCGVIDRKPDLIAGKTAFVQKCGSCHTLNRAGTKGSQGPNLDNAFRESLSDGIKRSTVRGVVNHQILYPNRRPQQDPVSGKELIAMPGKLVKGNLAADVSAYVASVVSRSGKDQGRLADVGTSQSKGTAKASGGALNIPTDPSGQLAYQFAAATAPAGAIDLKSVNKSSTPHDIAITGSGVNAKGKIVSNGGVSEVKATLKPGTYTFFCTVPGHEQAGM